MTRKQTPDLDQYADRPVPVGAQTTWHRVGLINGTVAFSLPTFVVGIEIAGSVGARDFVVAVVVGFLVIAFIGALAGVVGARTHLSSYALARIAFGRHGAALVNVAFAVSLLGWFGVNIDLLSDAVARLSARLFDWSPPNRLVEIIGGAVMIGTTTLGFRAIATLSACVLPVMAAVTGWLAFNLWTGPVPAPEAATQAITLGEAISAAVGSIIIGAIIMPDTTRFIDRWAGAVKVSVLAFMIATVAVSLVAGYSSYASGTSSVLDTMLEMNLGVGAFAIVIAGCWVLNSLNLYSCSLAFKASFPRLTGTVPIVAAGCLGVVAASFDILDHFIDFLVYLSLAFVPVAGAILVDYYVARRNHYEQPLVAGANWSWRALGAWLGGAAVALLAAKTNVSVTSVPACDALIVSGLVYWCLTKVRSSPAA